MQLIKHRHTARYTRKEICNDAAERCGLSRSAFPSNRIGENTDIVEIKLGRVPIDKGGDVYALRMSIVEWKALVLRVDTFLASKHGGSY